MKGLAQAVVGMKLPNTDSIAEQGKRAYRFGIELSNNPFKSDLERKVWENGWKFARDVWFALLRRNEGTLTGFRNNITSHSV